MQRAISNLTELHKISMETPMANTGRWIVVLLADVTLAGWCPFHKIAKLLQADPLSLCDVNAFGWIFFTKVLAILTVASAFPFPCG